MKTTVTGATGLLGRSIMGELAKIDGFKVTGLGFSRAEPPLVKLDLMDKTALRRYFRNEKAEIIVHCAAERRPDVSREKPEESRILNVAVTEQITGVAAETGAFLLYISSDYIFDGTSPPYRPDSKPNPINFYGSTKLAGEEAILKTCPDYCILRIPMLYGGDLFIGESSVTSIAAELERKEGGSFDNWATRYPTCTSDVAGVITQILEYRTGHPGFSGIFQWSGAEPYTKYEMALVMAEVMGIQADAVHPVNVPSGGTKRPQDCHLDCSALEQLGIGLQTPFKRKIRELLKKYYHTI